MNYIFSIGIILILLIGWVTVQYVYRYFAVRHPELGPYRDELGSCGNCGCGIDSCTRE
uniref:Uncharacterized protein n=1 Tax=Candidatus Kentrum sp. LFY TaxID=2126342 RepID=A0A450UUR2_9GAMM|nr:MAG: hypothetical protein BECKLFY1418B_GA0070995_10833 [Candidatus Kentron sp. LFY]VFK17725.1 MAG: hypothetical protein BECKLFY1418C_GA0070996_10353 [Candidatus Kentron sp. LFY]